MGPLEQLDVLMPQLQKLVSNTPVDQLDRPTPCTEWAIRDLYGHLIGGGTTFAAAVRGDDPPAIPAPGDAELSQAVLTAAGALDASFRAPGALERIVPTPFGEMPGEMFARVLAFDVLMHMWDLAQATGQSVDVPDEVVAEIESFARSVLAPEMRGAAFAPEGDAAAGASPLERLVAFSGRRPLANA